MVSNSFPHQIPICISLLSVCATWPTPLSFDHFSHCKSPQKINVKIDTIRNISLPVELLLWEFVSPSPHPQTGGPPLVGCTRLLSSIPTAKLHIWRLSPLSESRRLALPWWQESTLHTEHSPIFICSVSHKFVHGFITSRLIKCKMFNLNGLSVAASSSEVLSFWYLSWNFSVETTRTGINSRNIYWSNKQCGSRTGTCRWKHWWASLILLPFSQPVSLTSDTGIH